MLAAGAALSGSLLLSQAVKPSAVIKLVSKIIADFFIRLPIG
jgi:hypothetical protein